MAIKYLVAPNERLARWILFLEEFDYAVEFKLGRMHLQVDHLSRLSEEIGSSLVDDRLIDDNFFVIIVQTE